MRWIAALALLALAAAGCAAPAASLPSTTPATVCDARMIDHNRRACEQRGGTFHAPEPGTPFCGSCSTTFRVDPAILCTSTGWAVTCTEQMPSR